MDGLFTVRQAILLFRLDERDHLVEVTYQESRAYLALSNLPKARAALFAAKTTANSTYVPPSVQVLQAASTYSIYLHYCTVLYT